MKVEGQLKWAHNGEDKLVEQQKSYLTFNRLTQVIIFAQSDIYLPEKRAGEKSVDLSPYSLILFIPRDYNLPELLLTVLIE
jgi:hypothetical protein